jgi:lipopolysaccharide/colanic/teichoic acid biosynthesis glycosyltransferase
MPTTLDLAAPVLRRERSAAAAFSWLAVPEPPARRLLNVAIALIGIFVTLPVMALIALAIRCTSPGPIVYVQTRVGLDRRTHLRYRDRHTEEDMGGVPFRMYKFRTMHVQAASADPQVWACPDDDRVTSIGRILRKTRLDELPQLFNVLHGDMNVVGPRPEQPEIFASLRRTIHAYTVRQRTRPGITGLAQVSQAYDRDVEDVKRKVALDLTYLRRQSVLEDLRIMLLTFPVMIGRRGGW